MLSRVNRDNLRKNGVVVYLRGTPEQLYERTRHDRNRPLLQTEDPLAKLRELYTQRDPLYREVADIVVDTGRQSVAGMTRELYGKLDLLWSGLPLPIRRAECGEPVCAGLLCCAGGRNSSCRRLPRGSG